MSGTSGAPDVAARAGEALRIPKRSGSVLVRAGRRRVKLTSLSRVYFPAAGYTKGDLLQYYADVSPFLLPHLADRAMVMKRYPNGIQGNHFFMKRTPPGSPPWVETCSIEHASASVIDFPVVQDRATLLWLVNLGCIDLNPWYARCADVDRPDFLNFDLDPVPPATFAEVRAVALLLRDRLHAIGAPTYVKTSGSKGIHIYVPIVRNLRQKQVWRFAKGLSNEVAVAEPGLVTAEYRIAKRPAGRVLVDYNQNAWGRTLASVYSVRPRPGATVSAPVSWEEVEEGVEIDHFTLANVPARLRQEGDLWRKLLWQRGRFDLEPYA